MKNLELSCTLFGELREQGLLNSMDNSGTGYSSLEQIKRLPADTLRIDKSFMVNIAEDLTMPPSSPLQ